MGAFLVISNRPLHAFFSEVFAVLLLATTAATRDKPFGDPSPLDATALSILNLSPPARPTPEKTNGARDALFDFRPPRLIPSYDLSQSSTATTIAVATSGALHITLEEAQARKLSTRTLILTEASADAASYHRKAAQSDYFPKVGAYLVNLHYNKFMGDTIQLFARRPLIPTITRAVPLFDNDQTFVGPTVPQPLTPLFKVHQAVRIARADERIARARANAASNQLVADVERAYFELLIAQRRQAEAEANVETADRNLKIASAVTTPVDRMKERETAIIEAKKALLAASDKVTELTASFTDLTGLPEDARLQLVPPPPVVIEADPAPQTQQRPPNPRPAIANDPEIVEAEEAVVKAKAANHLAKLEYVPEAAITGGYMFQTGIPILPDDFSLIGAIGAWTVFDLGKREGTIKERGAKVTMAKADLELVREKAAAGARKTVMDVDQVPGPEARAAPAKAEAEMFQAELDYQMICAQMKLAIDEQ